MDKTNQFEMTSVPSSRIVQLEDQHDQTYSNEKQQYDMSKRRRSKKFRRDDSNRSILKHHIAINDLSEMERNEYWEQHILNQFELEEDQEDTPEHSRNSVYDMLSKDPEKLREVVVPLRYRKNLRAKMNKSVGLGAESKKESKTFIVKQTMTDLKEYKRGRENLRGLWASDIKNIEGKYGSGVGTYFRFLRTLLYHNISVSIFSVCFLYVPQIIYHKQHLGDDTFYNQTFHPKDIFTGKGWLNNTELYYGFYTNESVQSDSGGIEYDIQKAYFSTSVVYYVLTMAIFAIWMAQTFKSNFVVDAQRLYRNVYCESSFSTWDFAVTGKKLMMNKYNANSSQLKELIESTDVKKKKDSQKRISKVDVLKWILAIFCWTVFLVATGLISWGAIELLEDIIGNEEDTKEKFDTLMEVSLILTFTLWILPMIFSVFLRDVREYDVRTKNYIELSRTFILAFVLLAVVIIKHLETVSNNSKEGTDMNCWENQVGEQMYQLLVLFIILLVVLPFLVETIQGIVCRGFSGLQMYGLEMPEFDIGRNTVYLIYAQTVTWIGFYFSPLLPVILIVILVITFYLKMASVRLNCNSSSKPWAASQMQSAFYLITFLSYFLAFGIWAVCFFGAFSSGSDDGLKLIPSSECGPFRGYQSPLDIISLSDSSVQDFFLFKSATPVTIYVFLLIFLYVSASYLLTRKKEVREMKKDAKSTAKENILLGIANKRAALEILDTLQERKDEKSKRRKSSKRRGRNQVLTD